jgi:hypothetical protein
MDEEALARTPLPLPCPERVVLISRKDPNRLAQAWDAGIVSVVSDQDAPNTVLLAIMAASLRVPRAKESAVAGENPAGGAGEAGLMGPHSTHSGPKRMKSQ